MEIEVPVRRGMVPSIAPTPAITVKRPNTKRIIILTSQFTNNETNVVMKPFGGIFEDVLHINLLINYIKYSLACKKSKELFYFLKKAKTRS